MADDIVAHPRAKNYFHVYVGDHPKTGEPCYVGKGQGTRRDYHNKYGKIGKHYNPHLNHIIKKYGPIHFFIVRDNLTEAEAFETEKALIAHFGRINSQTGILCNRTDGGDGVSGSVFTPERRAQRSEAAKKRTPRTAEHCANLSAALKGRPPPPHVHALQIAAITGRALSEDHKAALSSAQAKIMSSSELRARVSAKLKGIVRSPETRAKMRAAQRKRFGTPGDE